MAKYSLGLAIDDADISVLIDEEFDGFDNSNFAASSDNTATHTLPIDDLAWEDQVDNGDEMSL